FAAQARPGLLPRHPGRLRGLRADEPSLRLGNPDVGLPRDRDDAAAADPGDPLQLEHYALRLPAAALAARELQMHHVRRRHGARELQSVQVVAHAVEQALAAT